MLCLGGVSVDESKDKQKWLDFIKTEGLKGVQLLAGGWSKITKDYKITGIPRFMVFDKKEISCRWMLPVLLHRN